MQRCRLPVDPRGTAVTVPVDPSAHAFDLEFLIFEVYTLSKLELWSLCLFLKIILIYIYIEVDKATVTVNHQRNL